MDARAIGIADSGLGGLTALMELRRLMPDEDIIFFGDSGRNPYGGRTQEELAMFARQNTAFLARFNVKAILLACGTMGASIPMLRRSMDTPLFGVIEPAVKIAAESTRNNRIAVIATAASIRSRVYQDTLETLCPQADVTAAACPKLVPLIESGLFAPEHEGVMDAVTEYLAPIRAEGADTLILGCTHYSLTYEAISRFIGPGVRLVPSSEEAARSLAAYIRTHGLESPEKSGKTTYYTSGDAINFAETAAKVTGRELDGKICRIPPFSL